jgi:hypothetical protein
MVNIQHEMMNGKGISNHERPTSNNEVETGRKSGIGDRQSHIIWPRSSDREHWFVSIDIRYAICEVEIDQRCKTSKPDAVRSCRTLSGLRDSLIR